MNSLAIVYVNAEGKANTEYQLRVILESVKKRHASSWIFVAISEADFRWSEEFETTWIGNHFVQRIPILGGRAAKIMWNVGANEFSRKVERSGRSFRVDLDYSAAVHKTMKPYSKVSVVISHLAHGDDWWDSFDDFSMLVAASPRGNLRFVLGDLNVEGRPTMQSNDDRDKWGSLTSALEAISLVSSLPGDSSTVTRRPRGLSTLISLPSFIDHCFVPLTSRATGTIVWDEIVGDHAWIDLALNIADMRVRRKRTTWKCSNPHDFRLDVLATMPTSFTSPHHFECFVAAKVEQYQSPLSARQRRLMWEPFAIKDLRARIRNCTEESVRVTLCQRLFKARVAWAKNRDIIATEKEVKAKRQRSVKRVNLFPLTEVQIDGVAQQDPDLWAAEAEKDFGMRWTQHQQADQDLFNELSGSVPASVVVYEFEVWRAIDQLKKPWALDHAGVCAAALRMVPEMAEPLSRLAAWVLSSDEEWDQISVQGFVKGKERGCIPMSKTRGLLPQTVFLNILNRIVMGRIGPILDAASESLGVKDLMLGGAKGSQPQNITFASSQVLEKGRDRHDAAAVAQADVEKFHDCVPWGFTLKALLARKVPDEWARAALRLHRCPRVQLRVGSATTRVLERSRSVLTGAASSGMLARLCIEDTYTAALSEMEPLGFDVDESQKLVAMSWSDNLFTFAGTAANAIAMMTIWTAHLWGMCGLRLKPGSHEVVKASTRTYGHEEFDVGGVVWKLVSTMISLGQCLTCNGDQAEDRRRVKRSWEAAFWRNAKVLTCARIGSTARLGFWGQLSKGIGSFRYCMWTPNKTAAKLVEGWNNQILQRILKVAYVEGESRERFCKRRNRIVASERERLGLAVSQEWALSLVRWVEHLRRHPELPAAILLTVQDDLWMQISRGLNWTPSRDASLRSGATRTRSGPGKPIRWAELWLEALQTEQGWDNANRSRKLTKQRADFLRNYAF